MRKTKRKILGFLGLFLVVAVTTFAAHLPNPEVSAVTSATDVIEVQVIGESPDVNFLYTQKAIETTEPCQTISFEYESVTEVKLTVTHTDKDGVERNYDIATYTAGYEHDEKSVDINLNDYGYGEYVFKVNGKGKDGVEDNDYFTISHVPVITTTEKNELEDYYINLDYDGDAVCYNEINLYLNNKLIAPPSPIRVGEGIKRVRIPFEEYDEFISGNYKIETIAYTCRGEQIHSPYIKYLLYEAPDDLDTPDTGMFFGQLNISKEDYLVTGLIVFFILGAVGLGIILRKDQRKYYRKKRR